LWDQRLLLDAIQRKGYKPGSFDLNAFVIKPAIHGHYWEAGWEIGFAVSYKTMFFIKTMGSIKSGGGP
jgi:hypothetical protein